MNTVNSGCWRIFRAPGIYNFVVLYIQQSAFCTGLPPATSFSFIILIDTSLGPLLYFHPFVIWYEKSNHSDTVECSSVGKACYCKSLWFAHHRTQPCWKCMSSFERGHLAQQHRPNTHWMILLRRSLTVEMKCASACCQKWKQQRPARESHQGGTGSVDWITGHFQNISSLTFSTGISCKLVL